MKVDPKDPLMCMVHCWPPTCSISSMASSNPVVDNTVSAAAFADGPAKRSIRTSLIFMALGALIASLVFGEVFYYLARSGRLSMHGSTGVKTLSSAMTGTHLMVLDPLLVNLADSGGSSYLRLSMTLQVADPAVKRNPKIKDEQSSDEAMVAVRDTAINVLGKQTSDSLLAADGKEHLKAELRGALAEHNADLKVKELFFTDFLVQR